MRSSETTGGSVLPAAPPLGPGEIHVCSVTRDVPGHAAAALFDLLSADERARAMRFHRDADRLRYIVAHGVLRVLLARYAGASAARLEFRLGEFGKPYLAPQPSRPRVHFSLAHSADCILLAFATTGDVGVDVEEIRDDVDVHALVHTVFSPAEAHVLCEAPVARQRALFFRSWARKEAVLKGCGAGLAGMPERVEVLRAGPVDDDALVTRGPDGEEWAVRDVEIGVGYAGAVAARRRDWVLTRFECTWPQRPGAGAQPRFAFRESP